jgi:hypothetical protein
MTEIKNEIRNEIKNELLIYDPIKTPKNIYYSRIIHNSEEISFQVAKNKIIFDKVKSKATLTLDEKSLTCIKKISDAVIELTSEKSKTWFGKELTIEECKGIFKNNLIDNNLLCFYDENTVFYDSKNTELDITALQDELYGIALIKCEVVVYTKTYFFIKWEIGQYKIKNQKSEILTEYLSEYKIKDLPEHSKTYKDDEIVKKLEEITLF